MSGKANAIRVGILGLGNIGSGTAEILRRNADVIERRLGAPLELARAADLDESRAAKLGLPPGVYTKDAKALVADPSIQIVVELIGGIEPARSLILAAMENGKHVVTANKALLATHWHELVSKAEEKRVAFGFEGSVGGGIPIIGTIRRGLVGNHIRRVTGIINGTCNYILTRMARERKPFAEILADAQANGFAEANPALDVDGIDAAQKLTVLVNLCFDLAIGPDAIVRSGIRDVTPLDLATAEELGYRMKLLGSTVNQDGQVEAWVHPALVPMSHPLAAVDGVFNALYLEDDNLGPSLYFGRGAGALPTGSAIVADLVSAARDILSGAVSRMPPGGARIRGGEAGRLRAPGEARSEFYLRVTALDRPGVLSAVTGVLGKHGVSIASVIQRGRADGGEEAVPVLIITHDASYADMTAALAELDALPVVRKGSFLARMIPETARV
jgi:homoserine dehydrogenase